VLWGLHDFLKSIDKKSSLIGFVGGTEGIFEQNTVEITEDVLAL
jgi:pyrophosphate--fructose-6-phosphate 1-phosphotransferase